MNKLYFWLDAHKWRIAIFLFVTFCVIATYGKTHSYSEAFFEFCGLYTATWFGTMAYLEKILGENK